MGEHRKAVQLVAEEDASLSSGSLRLYARPINFSPAVEGAPSVAKSKKSVPFVGCIDLYSYDPLNRRCAVGIMVATDYRRKGYALAMLHALEKQYSGKIHCLYADIAATNTASQALFRKAGYTECGRFKEWLEYDSHFIDNIRMQLILK